MLSRYDIFAVIMLKIHKFRGEFSLVVIIDDSDEPGADGTRKGSRASAQLS